MNHTEAAFWTFWGLAILYVTLRLTAKLTFRVRCPCCKKEIIIDPKREVAHLPTFRDRA